MPTNTLNNIPWPHFSLELWPQFPTNFTPWAVPGTLSTATPSHSVLTLKILWIRSPLSILKSFLKSPSDTSDKLKGILKWHEGTFDSSFLDTKCSVVYICRDLGWEELAGQKSRWCEHLKMDETTHMNKVYKEVLFAKKKKLKNYKI